MKTRLSLLCLLAFAFSNAVFAESVAQEGQPGNEEQSSQGATAGTESDCSGD